MDKVVEKLAAAHKAVGSIGSITLTCEVGRWDSNNWAAYHWSDGDIRMGNSVVSIKHGSMDECLTAIEAYARDFVLPPSPPTQDEIARMLGLTEYE